MNQGMQAGTTIQVRVRGTSPGGGVVRSGKVTAEFWAPGRDPEKDPFVRMHPDHIVVCQFDPEAKPAPCWAARADTTGWEPGSWTVRGRVLAAATPRLEPEARGWAYQTFPLAA